jgi:hypothetical protein
MTERTGCLVFLQSVVVCGGNALVLDIYSKGCGLQVEQMCGSSV